VSADRGRLIDRFAAALTVSDGRRAGDPETRVRLDHLMPAPGATPSPARWRLMTYDRRLYPPPVSREPLRAWHSAEGAKGRRLLALDLLSGRTAALASWHFEPGGPEARPHLVTSAAVAAQAVGDLHTEYLVALELLVCIVLAIDERTVQRGAIGLARDSAIELDASQLNDMGFVPAPRRGGYSGDYWWLRRADW
jgi:hypothetical protein